MKILLIYPYCLEDRIGGEDIQVVPIGLYFVAAILKENHFDVEILNWHHLHNTPEKIRNTLAEKRPDVIGFSILHANRWGGIEIARMAKHLNPRVHIVFGGVGATHLWHHLLSHFREIDYAVVGEGEYTFLDLVRNIERGNTRKIDDIKGLAYLRGDTPVYTGKRPAITHLDLLPNPAKYFVYRHVSSTRGCPQNCTFCGSPEFWGNTVRFHSPNYFVDELERLYQKGITFFYFSDDTFTIKKNRVIDICKKIIQRKLAITWVAISHVQYIREEILPWMRKAGCIQISYGVESGSEKIRHILGKHIHRDQIKKVFEWTKAYGMLPRAYFIYGSPGENEETIQETIEVMQQIEPLSAIFYILDIFPGTALYHAFKKRTKTTDDIWLKRIEDIMYFETDTGLTAHDILTYGQKLRTSFYESLPQFVENIRVIDRKDLYESHADFFSRIALTFSHGDYAAIDMIRDKDEIARKLHEKSLSYFPNHRAYLGLGMIFQKRHESVRSMDILDQGLKRFPDNEALILCQGINYMNLGRFDRARDLFLRCDHSPKVREYLAECERVLGR